MPKLIFLSGSIRKDSVNVKLARCALSMAEEIGGADVTYVDLSDFELPIYNGDLEAESGLPENVERLKKVFVECDGFFIASPEYNSSFSALLKNVIDWVSRPSEKGEPGLLAFAGKVAAISSASPGGLGGLRGLVPLRMLLGNLSVHVVPEQIAVSGAFDAFDEAGLLIDDRQRNGLLDVVSKFVNMSKMVSVK